MTKKPVLNDLKALLKLATKLSTAEKLEEHKITVFEAIYRLALDNTEIETVLKAIAEASKVSINPLKADWKTYLSSQSNEKQTNPTQADKLVKLALENLTLFHAPDGEGFADLIVNGVRQTHALRTKAFRDWLSSTFFDLENKAPGGQALQDTLGALEGQARFRGEEHQVFVRFAVTEIEGNTRLYLDLGTSDWSAIEIDSSGWKLVNLPPVRFKRPKSLRSLPMPVTGGSVKELLPVLNLGLDEYPLLAGWLASCFMPKGAYPLLNLLGEQGTAKTTTARFIKNLIDPAEGGIRSAPRNEDDLIIGARGSHILAFDNLSSVSPALSDALCRLSTGGGIGKRTLYSDSEETIIEAMRPVILTGIEELATRPDLLDRAVLLELPLILETGRKPLEQIEAAFLKVAPRVLGALLTAASQALKNKATVKLDKLPRMADFAVWVTACESALDLKPGEFLLAYAEARNMGNSAAIDSHPVPQKVIELLSEQDTWIGTFKKLLEALLELFPKRGKSETPDVPREFPKSPKALGDDLRRYATVLRAAGIEYTKDRSRDGIEITLTREPTEKENTEKPPDSEQKGFSSSQSTQVNKPRQTQDKGSEHSSELGVNIDSETQAKFTPSTPESNRVTQQSVLDELGVLEKPLHSKIPSLEPVKPNKIPSSTTVSPEIDTRFLALKPHLSQVEKYGFDNLIKSAQTGNTHAFAKLLELETKIQAKQKPQARGFN